MPNSLNLDETTVSVVIPAYNARETIAETLASVFGQTHRRLDIVVVDDGSTDGTWEVLQSFGSAIRPIRQPNSGIAVARNRGVEAAWGEFIALLDADDICEPERIAVQLKYLKSNPDILLCSSDFSGFDERGMLGASYCGEYYTRCSAAHGGASARYSVHEMIDIGSCFEPQISQPMQVQTMRGAVYEDLALGNFIHPPTVMFPRATLKRAGYFDPQVKIVCEWEWFVRVARLGPVGYIDRPLLKYRLSASQISAKPKTAVDSLRVAEMIHARDPKLREGAPGKVRRHLGALTLSAAYALSDEDRVAALKLLLVSGFFYRVFTRKTLRVLIRIVLPTGLLNKARHLRAGWGGLG
ncbi:glycosyltransferase family 2 protein [Thiomonas sp. FB-Cd]|uniref:glycosyltransferase family 2 protein n=1 Tax=Thiomonas sp. FB-Cd TaxID=1158292 RepID=UPI0004DF3507|nr:glycosyltransferase family 2 protein [Thiomonas sp. FB-Cd]